MTPKEQFLETSHAKTHREIVATEHFREALNYAMLEMQRVQCETDPEEPFAAAKQASRMSGAAQFRSILEKLATMPAVPQGTPAPSLNYDAYDRPKRSG